MPRFSPTSSWRLVVRLFVGLGALTAVGLTSGCIYMRPQASRDADMRVLAARPEVLIAASSEGPGVMASDIDISRTRMALAIPTGGLTVTLPFLLSNEFERGARLTAQYHLWKPTPTVAEALQKAVAADSASHIVWRLVSESDAAETVNSPPTVRVGPGLLSLRHVPFRGRLYRIVYDGGAVVRVGENVAHGSEMFPPFAWFGKCHVSAGKTTGGMTRDRLLANDAALLKSKLDEAQRACGEQLGQQLLDALRALDGGGGKRGGR